MAIISLHTVNEVSDWKVFAVEMNGGDEKTFAITYIGYIVQHKK